MREFILLLYDSLKVKLLLFSSSPTSHISRRSELSIFLLVRHTSGCQISRSLHQSAFNRVSIPYPRKSDESRSPLIRLALASATVALRLSFPYRSLAGCIPASPMFVIYSPIYRSQAGKIKIFSNSHNLLEVYSVLLEVMTAIIFTNRGK